MHFVAVLRWSSSASRLDRGTPLGAVRSSAFDFSSRGLRLTGVRCLLCWHSPLRCSVPVVDDLAEVVDVSASQVHEFSSHSLSMSCFGYFNASLLTTREACSDLESSVEHGLVDGGRLAESWS